MHGILLTSHDKLTGFALLVRFGCGRHWYIVGDGGMSDAVANDPPAAGVAEGHVVLVTTGVANSSIHLVGIMVEVLACVVEQHCTSGLGDDGLDTVVVCVLYDNARVPSACVMKKKRMQLVSGVQFPGIA